MPKKRAITGFGVTLLFILGIAIFFYMNFRTVIVSGNSMEPYFLSGQRLLASQAYWLVGPIRNGDVVVVREADREGYFIKRVYKQGGEVVDWQNVPEDWSLPDKGEYRVPSGHVFVLGDNRAVSEDSKIVGNATMRPLLKRMPPEEAETYRNLLETP